MDWERDKPGVTAWIHSNYEGAYSINLQLSDNTLEKHCVYFCVGEEAKHFHFMADGTAEEKSPRHSCKEWRASEGIQSNPTTSNI